MATPTLDSVTIEVVLNGDPLMDFTTASWTDISGSCCGTVSLTRGRSSSLDLTQPGRMSFEIDNYSSEFDPLNPAATYIGLRPRCPVRLRIQETDSASSQTTHTLFVGYLDSWSTSYRSGFTDVVTLTATDALGAVLPRLHELQSEWEYWLTTGSVDIPIPESWFRMDEEFVETAFNHGSKGTAGNGVHVLNRYNSGFNITNNIPGSRSTPGIIVGENGKAVTVRHRRKNASTIVDQTVEGLSIAAAAPATTTYGYAFVISAPPVVELPYLAGSANAQRVIYRFDTDETANVDERVEIKGGPTEADWGKIEWHLDNDAGTTTYTVTSSTDIADGQPHLVHCNRAGAVMALLIDGVEEGTRVTTATDSTWTGASDFFTYGADSFGPIAEAVLDDLVIFSTNLVDADYLYDIMSTPLSLPTNAADPIANSHLPGNRASVILDRAGWHGTPRDLAAGDIAMGPAVGGQTPLEALRQCEASEGGWLFISRAGYITFWARDWRFDTTQRSGTVQRTFTDASGATTPTLHRFASFHLDHSEESLRTKVAVPWAAGVYRAESKVDDFGPAEHDVAGSIESLADATTVGDNILAQFDTPWPIGTLELDNDVEGDVWDCVGSIDIGDRVEVSWSPTNGPGRFVAEWHIEQIDLTIGNGTQTLSCVLRLRLIEGTLFLVESDNLAYDSYGRADSATVGNAESGDSYQNTTNWEIKDRQLLESSGAITVPVINASTAEVDVTVTWPAATRRQLQLRSDSGGTVGLLVGWANATTTEFQVAILGGATLSATTVQGYPNDVVRVVLSGSTATCYVDGVQVVATTDASIGSLTGTYHGIRGNGAAPRVVADTLVINPA